MKHTTQEPATVPSASDPDCLAELASTLNINLEDLREAVQLNPETGEIASPEAFCWVIGGLPRDVYDQLVSGWGSSAWHNIPEPADGLARAALEILRLVDRRFIERIERESVPHVPAGPWGLVDWVLTIPPGMPDARAAQLAHVKVEAISHSRWLAKRFPAGRRRIGASHTHHVAVASLPEAVGDELLDRAVEERWPVSRMRKEAKAEEAKAALAAAGPALGDRLREARKRAGLTQAQLAAAMGDGYDQSVISDVERNKSALRVAGAAQAARALSVSLDYLVGSVDDPAPRPAPATAVEAESAPSGTGPAGPAWWVSPPDDDLPNATSVSIGSRVREARERAGLSQGELAARLNGDAPAEPDPRPAAGVEQENRISLASDIAQDALALRVTADAVYEVASSGHGTAGVYHVVRALALGLRTLQRDAEMALKPDWTPPSRKHPLNGGIADMEIEC